MSAHHKHPTYVKNARLVRQSVNARVARNEFVPCIRCGGPIGKTYDVGHVIDASRGGSHDISNLDPEHRFRFGPCPGNRRLGGQLGARKTNAKRKTSSAPKSAPSNEGRLPW